MWIRQILPTPAGPLCIEHDGHVLQRSFFAPGEAMTEADDLFSDHIRHTLAAWCADPASPLHVPLAPAATAFQQRFRECLLAMPCGSTTTYGALAKQLNSGPRAVGQACKHNPLVIFVPCHRVLGKDSPGGYLGRGEVSSVKLALLAHEQGCPASNAASHS